MTDETTNDNNVVALRGGSFPTPVTFVPEDEDYVATLPTPEELNALLQGKKPKGIIVITMNSDGFISDYTDGFSHLERVGVMNIVQQCMVGGYIWSDEVD